MKENDFDPRPLDPDGDPTVDGLSLVPEADGRARKNEHDLTNAWGERVVEGEGAYPGPDALRDEAPDDTDTDGRRLEQMSDEEAHELDSAHGGSDHKGVWPNPNR